MVRLTAILVAAALTAIGSVTAVQNTHFFVNIHALLYGRMDPIISPGKVAGHTHIVFGSNNFRSRLNTPEEQLAADCTTAGISADKSNYWALLVFFINDDGKYEPLMTDGGRAYYFTREKAVSFPKGFRMIAGVATNRDPYRPQLASVALGYIADGKGLGPYLPNTTTYPEAPSQFAATITYPSCGWANQTLDTKDHQSHMTYPVAVMGGGATRYDQFSGVQCPETHPVKYPNMHLEIYYKLSDAQKAMWNNGKQKQRLILANGDTVGPTMHADYVFGWDEQVFAAAINCPDPEVEGQDKCGGCASLCAHRNPSSGRNCRYAGMVPAENLGWVEPLAELPGCNKRWDASAGDAKPKDCTAPANPGWAAPNAYFQRGARYGVPIALETGGKGLASFPLADYQSAGDAAYLEGYSNQTFCCGDSGNNSGRWHNATEADILANKDISTAPNKIDTVWGMKDASEFKETAFMGSALVSAEAFATVEIPKTVMWIQNGVKTDAPPDSWFATVGAANGGYGGGNAPAALFHGAASTTSAPAGESTGAASVTNTSGSSVTPKAGSGGGGSNNLTPDAGFAEVEPSAVSSQGGLSDGAASNAQLSEKNTAISLSPSAALSAKTTPTSHSSTAPISSAATTKQCNRHRRRTVRTHH